MNYEHHQEDELVHYGVKGMRWGVKRATKRLAKAKTRKDLEKAEASLQKHRAKSTAKLQKLKSQGVKLEKDAERAVMKTDVKAANARAQASVYKRKSRAFLASQKKKEKYLLKANELELEAERLESISKQAKAKVESNKAMQKAFETGIKDIDKALANKGESYVRVVENYWKLGDKYRAKAEGTGNVSDGTFKPGKGGDKAFAKNIRKSDSYYRQAQELERDYRRGNAKSKHK